MSKRRVVVTGLGIISPVGNSVADAWQNLLAGRSGIVRITKFDPSAMASQIAGEVHGFDVSKYLSAKEARRMDTFIHYGLAAGVDAIKDSGIEVTDANRERIGVNIGSGIGGFDVIEREHTALMQGGPRKISPFFIPAAIVNLASGFVSIRWGAKGPNSATCTACSSSAHAVGDSYKLIQRCDADVMICGGAEAAITPMGVGGFASMRALSTRKD